MSVSDLNKIPSYPKHAELLTRILDVIYEYEGEISMVAVLGILDLVKDEIKRDED